eukprot:6453505-Pyramimonas_sp.AAC.1
MLCSQHVALFFKRKTTTLRRDVHRGSKLAGDPLDGERNIPAAEGVNSSRGVGEKGEALASGGGDGVA